MKMFFYLMLSALMPAIPYVVNGSFNGENAPTYLLQVLAGSFALILADYKASEHFRKAGGKLQ